MTDLRRRAGMSFADVERATGIRLGTVSKLESGEMNVTPKYFEQLAPVYGCELRDFLPPAEDEPQALSADEARLIAAARVGDRSAALHALAACLGVPVTEIAVISNPAPRGLAEAAERLQHGARELLAAAEALRS